MFFQSEMVGSGKDEPFEYEFEVSDRDDALADLSYGINNPPPEMTLAAVTGQSGQPDRLRFSWDKPLDGKRPMVFYGAGVYLCLVGGCAERRF